MRLGLSSSTIHLWVHRGLLFTLHNGVYAVGRPVVEHRGRLLASVRACGPESLLSHRSAGAHQGIYDYPVDARIDVLCPWGKHRGRGGVALHHTRYLPDSDRAELDRIPVTSVARTLRDLASMISFRRLRDGFERAERAGILDVDELFEILSRSNGHRGVRALRRLTLARFDAAPRTRSILELRFFRLNEETTLPLPEVNAEVLGFEVDFLWRDAKLVVETDGGESHSRPADRERDAARDLALQRAGFLVVRVSYWQVYDRPGAVVGMVAELLGERLHR